MTSKRIKGNMMEIKGDELGLEEDVTAACKPENQQQTVLTSFLLMISSLKIEPVMFLFMFSFILNTTCLTNMMMDKGCLFYFNYSEEVCRNLSFHREANDNVEILANNYNLYLNLLVPIAAFVVIFLAPWSDRYGRKPLLLGALTGFFLNDIGIILCAINFRADLHYIILANLPVQLSGGFICIMSVIYSYISDSTEPSRRSLKYTFLQVAFGLAVTLGALAGGKLFQHLHYLGVFVTMSVGHLLAILWVLLVLPESVVAKNRVSVAKRLGDIFSTENFTDGLKTCFKRREDNARVRLWLLLLSSCTTALTYEVYTDIMYVYAHHMYGWNPTTYSEWWTLFSLVEMVVVVVCTPLLIRVVGLSDPVIGIIGSVSIICKSVFLAFAFELPLYFVSNFTGCFNGLGNLAVRSLISKLIAENEVGRIFSFLATCEAIVPLLGNIFIVRIFNATIKVFPGACFLSASFFLLLPLFTFIWHLKLDRFQFRFLPVDSREENTSQ